MRDPLYLATAHFVIATGRSSIPTLVSTILTQLELGGVIDPYSVPSVVDPLLPHCLPVDPDPNPEASP